MSLVRMIKLAAYVAWAGLVLLVTTARPGGVDAGWGPHVGAAVMILGLVWAVAASIVDDVMSHAEPRGDNP